MKFKYLIFLYLPIFSCNSTDNDLYEFDPRTIVENKITLAEIADDITYTPLDNSYPIGIYYDTKIINNSIYISGKDIGVLAFNRDGQMPRKIGDVGRGPGKYLSCMSFDVDYNKGTVYVLDLGMNIKVYSKVGSFIRDISLQDYEDPENTRFLQDVDFYNNKLFLSEYTSFGKAKYNWIVIDTLGNLINHKINSVPAFTSNMWNPGGTYKFKNRIFYYDQYSDTVFSILPNLNYEASFLISPGKERLQRIQFDEMKEWQDYMIINFIFETSRFWVLNYSYKSKILSVLIDKKSKKSYLIDGRESNKANIGQKYSGGIINDLDGGIMFQPENYIEENNQEYMIELLPPHILKTYVASSEFRNSVPKYPEKKKELEKLAASLKETDNPVLVMVKMKK
jgi:hypothetical protein